MFEQTWKLWKKGFDAWEAATSQYLETVVKAPTFVAPAGNLLTSLSKARAQQEKMIGEWWSAVGISTRRDQERVLHQLHELSSRIIDLEEQLEDMQRKKS